MSTDFLQSRDKWTHVLSDGSMIVVLSDGPEWQPCDMGYRQRYTYVIRPGAGTAAGTEYVGNDIYSPVSAVRDARQGMESVLSVLSAYGESVASFIRTGTAGENLNLFPEHLQLWAYENADEIGMIYNEMTGN